MKNETIQAEAARAGIDFETLKIAFLEAIEIDRAETERENTIRKTALALQGFDHGGRFKLANRGAWAGGDETYLPGLDATAQHLASTIAPGITTGELYDFLASPARKRKTEAEILAETVERFEALSDDFTTDDFIPLEQAAEIADITPQWLRKMVRAGKITARRDGRKWFVSENEIRFFSRHPTAGRPRFAPF